MTMISNLDKYKKDINNLIKKGEKLLSILRTNLVLGLVNGQSVVAPVNQ